MKRKHVPKLKQIGYVPNGQFWPRKEAVRILKLETREEMNRAIEKIDFKFRDWVKFYVNDWSAKMGGIENVKRSLR